MTQASKAETKPIIDVLLVGLGSIGTIYAYMLEKTGRARVTAVARSNYKLYTTDGVTVDTDRFGKIENWKPYRVVKSQEEAFEDTDVTYDICLITTKCLPDVLPNSTLLAPAIASGRVKAFSLIQNGLAVEADLYKATRGSGTPIISSLAWIGIMTSPDGKVVSWRGQDKMVSGLYAPPSGVKGQVPTFNAEEQAALDQWHSILLQGGANISVDSNIEAVRFQKNVWNCAWSSIQGLIRSTPLCLVDLSPDLQEQLKKFIREIVTVGFASGLLYVGQAQPAPGVQEVADMWEGEIETEEQGIEFTTYVAYTRIMLNTQRAGGGHKMSLLIDVEQGRPIEVEVIVGAVLDLARTFNVSTPLLDFVYVLLKGVQVNLINNAKAAKEAITA